MVEIREWEMDDVFSLRNLSMHPYFVARRVSNYLYPDTFFNTVHVIKGYQNANKEKYLIRAILYHNVVCGFIQCEKKDEQSCEISYWLGYHYWNRGIMKKAIALICREAFTTLHVMSIFGRVKKENIASCKVLESNRFRLESQDESIYIYRKFR